MLVDDCYIERQVLIHLMQEWANMQSENSEQTPMIHLMREHANMQSKNDEQKWEGRNGLAKEIGHLVLW